MRAIFASNDINLKMRLLKKKKFKVYSFYPVDRASCECQKMIQEWRDKLRLMNDRDKTKEIAKTEFITCPKSKIGYKRYKIYCSKCKELQGYVYAKDKTLTDFFDFHYFQWSDGERWYGCLTPNISPIDEKLTLECCCGQDNRDFRGNNTLPLKTAIKIEDQNKIGRNYGVRNSKFLVN